MRCFGSAEPPSLLPRIVRRIHIRNRERAQAVDLNQHIGLGDREVFQRYFREAYEHGYADGYAGY